MAHHPSYSLQEQDALVPSLCLLEDARTRAAVLDEVAAHYGIRGRLESFPGGHPSSLTRADLARVRTEPCVVALKSDGVRYLLYLCCLGGAFKALCIDRRLRIYEVVVWCNEDYFTKRTLFDGELVFDCSTNRLCYQVFDTVVVRGSSCRAMRYCDRLQTIHNHVLGDLPEGMIDDSAVDEYISSEDKVYCARAANHMHLCMVPKRFVTWQNGRALWDARNAHPFPNDGLVLNFDDCPVRPGTLRNALKWKPNNAIDVLLDAARRVAFCRKDGVEMPLKRLVVSGGASLVVRVADNELVQCLVHRQEARGAGLVECLVDVTEREVVLWPMKERTDKAEANDLRVIESTLATIGDAVSVDELFAPASDLGARGSKRPSAAVDAPNDDHSVRVQTRARRRAVAA